VGDLPVLGRLFSSQVDNSQRTELVLAITPRVLRNVRRPDANETELWVGTEAQPRLRPVGGLRAAAAPAADNASAPARGAPGPALMAPEPLLVPPVPAAIEPVIVFKWSGPPEVKVGDTLELKLELTAKTPLRGTPMEIAFPKDKLQLIDVAEGEFFRRDGAATSFSKGGDGKEGRVGVGVLRNQGNGLSGVGSVLTLKFKAMNAGPVEVKLMSAQGIGLEGPLPPPTLGSPFAVQIR
jgi:general secretion pathway protein D